MFKRLARSPAIPYLLGTLIWAYQSILAHTIRWKVEGVEHVRPTWDDPKGFVLASWHSRILLMPMLPLNLGRRWARAPGAMALMVSNSRDGEFTQRAGTLLGLHIIRGSAANKSKTKDKRGFQAAREALEFMRDGGGICVTIDGPKGPPEVVGIGAVKLAQQMNVPIVIYGLSAAAKRLQTWDRLLFPAPFTRGAVVFAEPVATSKDMDSETLRQEVERRLRAATVRADALAGLAPLTDAPPPVAPAASDSTAEHGEP